MATVSKQVCTSGSKSETWNILVVDAENKSHDRMRFLLDNLVVRDKTPKFMFLDSVDRAKRFLDKSSEFALILLSLENDENISLLEFIRREKSMHHSRIILGTCQDACEPEREALEKYDVDYSCSRAELNSGKFYMMARSALTNYYHIKRTRYVEQNLSRAQSLSRAKSNFMANLTHEIRTPIFGVVGTIDLLSRTAMSEEQQDLVRMLNAEADSLNNLINQILDLSKMEVGKQEIEEIKFDLLELMDSVVDSMGPQAYKKGLELNYYICPDVSLNLIGDPVKLKQILFNLTGNAIKFTQTGEVFIKVELKVGPGRGGEVELLFSLTDTGVGIPKEKQKEIFESYVQADTSIARKYGGTGLGTAISKKLCNLMRGDIGLRSKEGEGSTFWFTAVCTTQNKNKLIVLDEYGEFDNMNVLIVSQCAGVRYLLTEYLREWNCRSVSVSNRADALRLLINPPPSKEKIHLIIIDRTPAERSGLEFLKTIRLMEVWRKTPIILTAPSCIKDKKKLTVDTNLNSYLFKPVKKNLFYQTLKSIFKISMEDECPGYKSTLNIVSSGCRRRGKRKARILLVEDNPVNQTIILRFLKDAGHHVDTAGNGKEAIRAYMLSCFDVVLMDLQMPEMDGCEATKVIREYESKMVRETLASFGIGEEDHGSGEKKIFRMPIIAMTAHMADTFYTRCMDAGMDDFMVKPVKREALLCTVNKWLPVIAQGNAQSDKG